MSSVTSASGLLAGIVEIVIEDDAGVRAVLVNADDLAPGVRELIEWVESAPGRPEQLGPPGTGPA